MLIWLVIAEVFRLAYPAARRGRKVAYLTLASFGFLIILLASLVLPGSGHGAESRQIDDDELNRHDVVCTLPRYGSVPLSQLATQRLPRQESRYPVA